jgi:hypothetical protein
MVFCFVEKFFLFGEVFERCMLLSMYWLRVGVEFFLGIGNGGCCAIVNDSRCVFGLEDYWLV